MYEIDEIIKAYTGTTLATEAELVPTLLSNELELSLRRDAVLQDSTLQNTELEGVPGDEVYIPRLNDAGTVGALTEGTDIPIISLDAADSVKFVPSEVGLAFGITRKALDRIKYDSIAIIVSQLGYAMTSYLEGTIANLYTLSVPGHAGETITQIYPNGHNSTNVVAADTFSEAVLLEGVVELQETDVPPFEDGLYRAYITPRQYKAFISDTNVRNDLRYASPQVMLRGEVGVYHNTRIVVTNWIKKPTENTIEVHKALLLSPRWAAIAWKRRPQVVLDPTLYDFGRRRQFAVTADLDIQLLHANRARVITTAK